MNSVRALTILFSSILFVGCMSGPQTYKVGESAAATGLAGGAIGAGSGALVGAVIANGDIGASAVLGAAIGIPAGIALGAMYAATKNERVLMHNDGIINSNKAEILRRQAEIDELRETLRDESMMFQPNTELRDQIYDGPTLGNVYR